MRWAAALYLAFLVTIAAPAGALGASSMGCDKSRFAHDQPVMDEVRDLFATQAAKHPIGSMTVGIVCGPDVVWSMSYGYADMESGKTASRDTVLSHRFDHEADHWPHAPSARR